MPPFLYYYLVRSRTRLFGLNLNLLTWSTLLLLPLILFFGLRLPTQTTILLFLLFLALNAGVAWYCLQLYGKQTHALKGIYDTWAEPLGAEPLDTTSIPEGLPSTPEGTRAYHELHKRLESTWNMEQLNTLVFHATPQAASLKTLTRYPQRLTKYAPVESSYCYLLSLEALPRGEIRVTHASKDTPQTREYLARMKMWRILEEKVPYWSKSNQLPLISLEATSEQCFGTPYRRISVAGALDSTLSQRDLDQLSASLQEAFPLADLCWSAQQAPEELVFSAVGKDDELTLQKKFVALLSQIVEETLAQERLGHSVVQAEALLVARNTLWGFTLVFSEPAILSEREQRLGFVRTLLFKLGEAGVLQEWKVSNNLSKSGSLVFTAEQAAEVLSASASKARESSVFDEPEEDYGASTEFEEEEALPEL